MPSTSGPSRTPIRYVSGPAPAPAVFPEEAQAVVEAPAEHDAPAGFLDRWLSLFVRTGPVSSKTWSEWWNDLWNPMPTAWFQSINPLLILLLAPVFAVLWTWLGRRGLDPPTPIKIALGLVLMALAFALLARAGTREGGETSVRFQGRKRNQGPERGGRGPGSAYGPR
jgi:hypothetical protein